jgi:hypothetical protein
VPRRKTPEVATIGAFPRRLTPKQVTAKLLAEFG